MTDPVDTEALRAIAQGFDAKGWVNNADHCRAAADELERLRSNEDVTARGVEFMDGVHQGDQERLTRLLRAAEATVVAFGRDRERLHAVIENAPHMDSCRMSYISTYPNARCTCWKADA